MFAHRDCSARLRCLFCIEMARVVAPPGIAPRPPVSETSALLIMQRGRKKWGDGLMDRWIGSTQRLACSAGFHESINPPLHHSNPLLVAREGSAPSISGCRPDVMLFHHRAVEARAANIGCLAWIR